MNNFAFNYHLPPTIDHKLSEKLRNANKQQLEQTKKKRIFIRRDFSSTKSVNKSDHSHFRRLLICCKTRTADSDD